MLLALLHGDHSFAADAELLRLAQESYRPGITYTEKKDGWSFYGCRMKKVTVEGLDPISFQPRKVKLKIYEAPGAKKTVLILPPTGGENLLDRGHANTLCYEGIRAVILQSWDYDTETTLDLGMHDRGALRSLAAIRHSLDYLGKDGPQAFGILGTSVGALSSALALGFEPR